MKKLHTFHLWDHRSWLKTTDFPNVRKIDVIICLTMKKGYPGFDSCAENKNFQAWCKRAIKQTAFACS